MFCYSYTHKIPVGSMSNTPPSPSPQNFDFGLNIVAYFWNEFLEFFKVFRVFDDFQVI